MTNDPQESASGPAATPAHREGQTTPVKDGARSPHQPHERDESSSSQQGAPTERMQQALDDIESGRADTSRAEATDQAYGGHLRDRGDRRAVGDREERPAEETPASGPAARGLAPTDLPPP